MVSSLTVKSKEQKGINLTLYFLGEGSCKPQRGLVNCPLFHLILIEGQLH